LRVFNKVELVILFFFLTIPKISLSQQIPIETFDYQKTNILFDAGIGWESLTNFSPIRLKWNDNKNPKYDSRIRYKGSIGISNTNDFSTIYSNSSFKYNKKFFCYFNPRYKINNENNKAIISNPSFIYSPDNTSGIGFENNWATLQIGRGNENWGSGNEIQLALSHHSGAYDYFLLASDYGRIRVRYIHGFLENVENNVNRYITARGFEWTNRRSLVIGFSEITIYSGENRSLDIGYINPMSSHLEIEYNNRLNVYGNRNSNAVWQMHFDFFYKDRLRISGNYLYDEFVIDPEIELGKEHGKAYSVRLAYTPALLKKYLITVYGKLIHIGTPTFRHGVGTNNFVQSSKPLGWYKGSDNQDLCFGFNFYNYKNLIVSILTGFNQSGGENILNRVFETYADYKKGPFPSGEIKETIYFETYFKYMLNSNVHIMGGIQRFKIKQDYSIDLGFSIQLLHYFLTNN